MAKKQSSYSTADLNTIQQSLLEEKARLTREIGEPLFHEMGDEVDDAVHEVEDFTVNKSVEVTFEKQLRDVNKALDRLEKGTYGICKYCDKEIDIKRLLARPTSSACVSCKKTLTDEA